MPLNIDFDILTIDLLPVELRTTAHIEWLKSLTKPVKYINNDLDIYYNSIIFDVTHVGQVLSLEHYLNIYFGLPFPVVIPNSIYIDDGVWLTELYSFYSGDDALSDLNNFGNVDANEPSDGQMFTFDTIEIPNPITDQIYSYSNTDYNIDQVDFYIYVETSWWTQDKEDKIIEITNRYKKVGKSFKIIKY